MYVLRLKRWCLLSRVMRPYRGRGLRYVICGHCLRLGVNARERSELTVRFFVLLLAPSSFVGA
jgi:DTW domain-containing protein YfiP